jgi:hypothetical protein
MELSIEDKYEALSQHCAWLTEALDGYIEESQELSEKIEDLQRACQLLGDALSDCVEQRNHLTDCVQDILTTHKLWGDGGYATNDGTIFYQRDINE